MKSNHADKVLVCQDCAANFCWSASEQAFYESRQLVQPKRCATCRRAKRERASADVRGHNSRVSLEHAEPYS